MLLAEIVDGLLSNYINMRWILKGWRMWKSRRLSIEDSSWLETTINLVHQTDEWIDQLSISPQHTRDVLNDIVSREEINTIFSEWQEINAQPAAMISRFFTCKDIDTKTNLGMEGIAAASATTKINGCFFHIESIGCTSDLSAKSKA